EGRGGAEPAPGLLDPGLAGGHAAHDDVVDPHAQRSLGYEADVEVDAIARVEVEPVELPALAGARDLDLGIVPRDRAPAGTQPEIAVVIHAVDLRPEPDVVAGARLHADALGQGRVDFGLLVASMLDQEREAATRSVLGRIRAPVGDGELPGLRVSRGQILVQARGAAVGGEV